MWVIPLCLIPYNDHRSSIDHWLIRYVLAQLYHFHCLSDSRSETCFFEIWPSSIEHGPPQWPCLLQHAQFFVNFILLLLQHCCWSTRTSSKCATLYLHRCTIYISCGSIMSTLRCQSHDHRSHNLVAVDPVDHTQQRYVQVFNKRTGNEPQSNEQGDWGLQSRALAP